MERKNAPVEVVLPDVIWRNMGILIVILWSWSFVCTVAYGVCMTVYARVMGIQWPKQWTLSSGWPIFLPLFLLIVIGQVVIGILTSEKLPLRRRYR